MNTRGLTSLATSAGLAVPGDARERQGTILMVLGGLILGTVGIFVLQANQDPLTTVAFRCFFGFLALLSWGLLSGRLAEIRLQARDLLGAVATGVLMIISWALHFAAIPRTSIGVSTVVFHIQPFWTMALGVWLLREKVSRKQVGAALLAFAGLVLTTDVMGTGARHQEYFYGLLMSLSGSFVYAWVPLLTKVMRSVSSFALAWWQCLVGAVLTSWWPVLYGWPSHWDTIAWLAGLGAIHTGLAYVVMFAGFARLSTGRTAALQFVYPMTAFVIDWKIYGHSLSLVQMSGLALMGIAIWSVKSSR